MGGDWLHNAHGRQGIPFPAAPASGGQQALAPWLVFSRQEAAEQSFGPATYFTSYYGFKAHRVNLASSKKSVVFIGSDKSRACSVFEVLCQDIVCTVPAVSKGTRPGEAKNCIPAT